MKIIKKECVFHGTYLRIVNKHFKNGKGQEGIWESIERKNIYNKGAVAVVAITKEKELILERNWRFPLESFVIQLPAGLTDKKGESEEEAARRELLEETGYLAGKLIPVISTPSCSSLIPTIVTHFFAPDVEFSGITMRDTAEKIEILKVPIEEVDDFFLNLPEDTELDLGVLGILRIMENKNLL
ncbi:MAG: NUDIX hydrolase [Syntrophobacterales bacterium]|nr:NUDIX hydrolase [Syntrophobacterales bacterium]